MTEIKPGTPLPWECLKNLPIIQHWKQGPDDDTGNVCIAECGNFRDKELVPFNGERWQSDARYIVHTANAYPSLLNGLREARQVLANILSDEEVALSRPDYRDAHDTIAKLDTLLSQEGGQ